MVSLSSRISPLTSTPILRDRSPLATAVVTSAMLRTCAVRLDRSEEHTSELQSLMRISYAVFCLKKKKQQKSLISTTHAKRKSTTTDITHQRPVSDHTSK